jgi:hypothetical protein
MLFTEFAPILAHLAQNKASQIIQAQGCSLTLQSGLMIHIEWNEADNKLLFYCTLLEVPAHAKLECYCTLLQLHLFGEKTQGRFFALHDDRDDIIFYQTITLAHIDLLTLSEQLDTFSTQAEYWYTFLSQHAFKPNNELVSAQLYR